MFRKTGVHFIFKFKRKKKHFVTGCSTTIKHPLRRTLVRHHQHAAKGKTNIFKALK